MTRQNGARSQVAGASALGDDIKQEVHRFWNDASCGENLLLESEDRDGYADQMRRRYELEPYIEEFASFDSARGLKVLEIGVGLGADHQRFAQSGAQLTGVDLTERAISHTCRRLSHFGLHSQLQVADAEALPFADESFDVVYSWGVLHHSPNTSAAVQEVWRVLRPGGCAKVMVYQKHSLVGFMLWARYALATGRPWRSLEDIYASHLESPGTKAYTIDQARAMFSAFSETRVRAQLSFGDLLLGGVGQRHRGPLLWLARAFWPRSIVRALLSKRGLYLLIEARR